MVQFWRERFVLMQDVIAVCDGVVKLLHCIGVVEWLCDLSFDVPNNTCLKCCLFNVDCEFCAAMSLRDSC